MATLHTFESQLVMRANHRLESGMPEHSFITAVAWSATTEEYRNVRTEKASLASKRMCDDDPYRAALTTDPHVWTIMGFVGWLSSGGVKVNGVPLFNQIEGTVLSGHESAQAKDLVDVNKDKPIAHRSGLRAGKPLLFAVLEVPRLGRQAMYA